MQNWKKLLAKTAIINRPMLLFETSLRLLTIQSSVDFQLFPTPPCLCEVTRYYWIHLHSRTFRRLINLIKICVHGIRTRCKAQNISDKEALHFLIY